MSLYKAKKFESIEKLDTYLLEKIDKKVLLLNSLHEQNIIFLSETGDEYYPVYISMKDEKLERKYYKDELNDNTLFGENLSNTTIYLLLKYSISQTKNNTRIYDRIIEQSTNNIVDKSVNGKININIFSPNITIPDKIMKLFTVPPPFYSIYTNNGYIFFKYINESDEFAINNIKSYDLIKDIQITNFFQMSDLKLLIEMEK